MPNSAKSDNAFDVVQFLLVVLVFVVVAAIFFYIDPAWPGKVWALIVYGLNAVAGSFNSLIHSLSAAH